MSIEAMSAEIMAAEPLLEIRALCAGYGDTEVLRGVDLNVGQREIVAVLGSNGVGKSTLNRTISGIVRARSGAIRFEGAAIDHEKPQAIVARGLIHVPEGRRIFPNLSVRDNLDLGSYRRAAAPSTASACSPSFRACSSGARRPPARFPAANSRCSPSAAD
jgi:ABC-type branched-subunit amino acid transport system ATPase component